MVKFTPEITAVPSVQGFKQQSSSSTQQVVNVDMTSNNAKQELLKRLGITEAQLGAICEKYVDFYSKSPEEQSIIVNNFDYSQNDNSTLPETSQDTSDTETSTFNYVEFASLSNEKKVDVYAEELARNRFLFSNTDSGRTQSDWEQLSDAQRQELISAAKSDIVKNGSEGKFNDKEISKILQYGLTKVQAANKKGISVDALKAMGDDEAKQVIHEYVADLDKENLSKGQQHYLQHQKDLTQAIVEYAKNKGINLGELPDVLSPAEVKQYCKQLGVTDIDVQKAYLLNLKENGNNLHPEQEKRLLRLTKQSEFMEAVENIPAKDYGRMTDLFESDFGDLFNSAQGTDEKLAVVMKYAKGKFEGLAPEQKRQAYLELISELVHSDPDIGTMFHEKYVADSSHDEQLRIIKSADETMRVTNAYNNNVFSEDATRLMSQDIVAGMQGENSDSDAAIAKIAINNADARHSTYMSPAFAACGMEEVEQCMADKGLSLSDDPECQNIVLTDVANGACQNVRMNTAIKLDQANEDNQLDLQEKFAKDKAVNDAMIEDGTFTRFADKNQVQALKNHKVRCEQDDYKDEDAIKSLNKLSDWIHKCENPDNQLAMHNEMMNSKYSEVQEHVAGNIKDYDPSIQLDAMDSVYRSGNPKAIETAVLNISEFKSPDVQQLALAQNNDIINGVLTKFANLSDIDIKNLAPAERQKFYVKLFENASPADKIKFLKSMKTGQAKQTVYNLIGTYYKNLFVQMVQDDVQTAEAMFNMGLKTNLHSIIEECIINKAETDPSFKFLRDRLKLTGEEEYPQTAKTVNYSSVPGGFANDKFNLFGKDKYGNLLA